MAYLGKTPSQAVRSRYYFTASGGETSLAPAQVTGLSFTDANYVDVSLNGVALVSGTDYTATPSTNTISSLAALTASDVVEIVVYDVFSVFGGSVNGDFTISNGTLAAEAVTVTGLTTTGNINFGDNDKANFGAGNDLQIYHNGAASIIQDVGSGDLFLAGDNNVTITNSDFSENKAKFISNGGAVLYYNNNPTVTVTSTGVDVTGTSKSDLVVIDSTGGATPTYSHTNNGEGLTLRYNDDSGARAADIVAIGNNPAGATMAMRFFVNPNSTDAASEVMRLQNGNVGIGKSSSITDRLHIEKSGANCLLSVARTSDGAAGRLVMQHTNAVGALQTTGSVPLTFGTNDTERMRITNTGNVGIGATNPNRGSHSRALLVSDTGTGARSAIEIEGNSSNANGTLVFLNNGTSAASIDNRGSGTLTFNVGSSLTEQARIENNGFLIFKTATDKTVSGIAFENHGSNNVSCHMTAANDPILILNRQSADGTLVQFRHADTTEGSIVVSGSTVSYNGGHLARWSQLADNTRDASIVKGTVMTNLDQMAEWTKDGVTEDNEQLNCMAVSSVEGDANVAGVFVNWDDDDTDFTADMNIAMTGDMVIRIAQGTTVARGDLLMSAGDGTAKPQGDDIVRSKTIAKVTSTTVSHTYDDGTYLVPCVLMAC
jgi:hypothetical protein